MLAAAWGEGGAESWGQICDSYLAFPPLVLADIPSSLAHPNSGFAGLRELVLGEILLSLSSLLGVTFHLKQGGGPTSILGPPCVCSPSCKANC